MSIAISSRTELCPEVANTAAANLIKIFGSEYFRIFYSANWTCHKVTTSFSIRHAKPSAQFDHLMPSATFSIQGPQPMDIRKLGLPAPLLLTKKLIEDSQSQHINMQDYTWISIQKLEKTVKTSRS